MTVGAMHSDIPPQRARTSIEVLVRQLLIVATILSITFPYVQFLPLGSYTQPYAIFLSAVVLVFSRFQAVRRMPWSDLFALVSLALVGVALFAATSFPYKNVQEYKYLLSYLTPIVVTVACFTLMEWDRRLVGFLVAASAVAWFWIGLAQSLLDPTFMTFLLGQWSTVALDVAASGRGVIALAPEPTYFAFHMLLLAGCIAVLDRHRWVILLCLLSAVLLARSASGFLVVGIAVAIAAFIYRPRLALLACLSIAAAVALDIGSAILSISTGNRFLTLIGTVLHDPLSIMGDYSTNLRIGGAVLGLFDTVRYLLVPHGMSFDHWSSVRLDILEEFPALLNMSTVGIPSGYGVLLFQAGLLIVPFIVLSIKRIYETAVTPFSTTVIIGVPVVFLFQYYFSAPQFGLIYACAISVWQQRSARQATSTVHPIADKALSPVGAN